MIARPTPDSVTRQLRVFDMTAGYHDADQAVAIVFDQWPRNRRIEEVLVKTTVLNRLYSTNVYGVYEVAKHIVGLDIEVRLKRGDANLVHDIADIKIGGKPRYLLSFASKYCHWHQPEHYQMYDSYVDGLLWQYRKNFDFARFRRAELRKYSRFLEVVDGLVSHFGLHGFSRKEIDIFLWMEGRRVEAD